jgi:hypothetical protein
MLRIRKELIKPFDRLHVLARKYPCIPCKLLNEKFECQINDFIDIDNEQFHIERKRIQVFILHNKKKQNVGKTKGGGVRNLDLLKFIK